MVDRNVLLYGTTEPLPETFELKAGPVTATFDAGQLRWIRLGGVEVIRAISFLIRDRNWSTAIPQIDNLKLDQGENGFSLEFDARCPTIDGDFVWHGSYRGEADGSLTLVGKGRPEKDFVTCRTGFVILHPLRGVVGEPMTVEHVDGSIEEAVVPAEIVPDQPYLLVRAMTHSPLPGVRATIRMEGDSWETEDHRNWTDASLKTYSRPLFLPWPYTIPGGEEVSQSVSLRFSGKLPAKPAQAGPVAVNLGNEAGAMPEIGISVLPEDAELAASASALVKQASVSHLNCRLDLRSAAWQEPLVHYRRLADVTGAKLALEIILRGDPEPAVELAPVAAAIREAGLSPAAVVVTPAADLVSYPPGRPFPAGIPSFEAVAAAARAAFPGARIGGGMLSNFTELNRKRPPRGVFDFITHATSSVVHAADDRSVMETLESIGHIVHSTKKLTGGEPYRIGPSHIGNSFNPYGSRVTPNPDNGRVTMARVEPRHRGLFGAAWHLGFLSQAANGGVEAATVASPAGEFGIAYRKLAHAQPWFDEAASPQVYPLYHVIAGIAAGAGRPRTEVSSGDTDRIRAVAWKDAGVTHLWLANTSDGIVDVSVQGTSGSATLAVLDEAGFEGAASDLDFMSKGTPFAGGTINLGAFAVARLSFGS
ncbi:hypothetical protein [Mesorhizobium sp. CN2-181]|uniref:hypothetical protein n=1 Tax=Mesorhizobium yinganensis TaxID=3157707 RepID=UPI0032B73C42